MSNSGSVAAEAIVQFAPKTNAKPEAGDPLDRAGKAILGLLHRAPSDAEANNKQAVEMAHQLSAQLRAAEDRIRQLEANARHHLFSEKCLGRRWLRVATVVPAKEFLLNVYRDLMQR